MLACLSERKPDIVILASFSLLVHGVICDESGMTDLENKHLAKRAKHSQKDTELVFPSDYPLPDQPINVMNSSPMSLYKKGNPESGTSPKREQSASDSPAQAQSTPHSCGTKVSAGGWFKNKGRGPEQDSILIDLCKEEAASPKQTNGVSKRNDGDRGQYH
uniref:Nuclear VCP like n=1 Tax=Oncorhynchus mykiss TaxID=8022 RepID=A0A8K9WVB6_ONCMY